MGSIVPFIREAAFGPDAIDAMSKAYDKARRSLHDRGQPAIVQEVIARRIVALAASGERDPDKLSVMALDVLGIDTSRF